MDKLLKLDQIIGSSFAGNELNVFPKIREKKTVLLTRYSVGNEVYID